MKYSWPNVLCVTLYIVSGSIGKLLLVEMSDVTDSLSLIWNDLFWLRWAQWLKIIKLIELMFTIYILWFNWPCLNLEKLTPNLFKSKLLYFFEVKQKWRKLVTLFIRLLTVELGPSVHANDSVLKIINTQEKKKDR